MKCANIFNCSLHLAFFLSFLLSCYLTSTEDTGAVDGEGSSTCVLCQSMSRTSWLHADHYYPMSFANVKNFMTTCRSLFILCPLSVIVKNLTTVCRSLFTLCPLPVNVKNFTTVHRSLFTLCPLPVNVKNVTTACRSLFILCPLPMSRTSQLHTDHHLSCVHSLPVNVKNFIFSIRNSALPMR